MTKWWHVSWKRVGLTLLIVFAALYSVSFVISALEPWYVTRELTKDDPGLNLVPVDLPDKITTTLTGLRVSFHGFSIQTPWNKIEKEKAGKGFKVEFFDNKAEILIFDPPITPDLPGSFENSVDAIRLLGRETLRSKYGYMSSVLEATPAEVKWWRNPKKNARSLVLLVDKGMATHKSGPIYSVESGELRGFQLGNPALAPYTVWLNLFDGSDRQYEICLKAGNQDGSGLSQRELNAMVASFKPVPHQ